MRDASIPNLKLEGLVLGPKAAGVDLRLLLYKGGGSTHRRWGIEKIESEQLGQPLVGRLPLLQAIHGRWQDAISSGRLAYDSVLTEFAALKGLAKFADSTNAALTTSNVMRLYLEWAAHTRARRDLKPSSAYQISVALSRAISPALGIAPNRIQWKSKIRAPKALGAVGAKESLDETASFVQLMLETAAKLPVEVVRGPLPVMLEYACKDGAVATYQANCGPALGGRIELYKRSARDRIGVRRAQASTDSSNTKRAQLINLRLEAELLIFISQTSCNVTQALQLTGCKFRYQSDGDYVVMRPWKERAKHAVELRIHKGYRQHFEIFLKWRDTVFPDNPDGLTFCFVYNDGDKAMRRTQWGFEYVRKLCKAIDRPFVPARQLRATVGNFFKRRSSRQQAAELLSDEEKTFQQHYEEPNHQRAAAELVSFFDGLESIVADAVGPGGCQKSKQEPVPQQMHGAPIGAPKPDCEGSAGCLFCPKNRDLRSFDHAWNLASLQHLTLLEFNSDHTGLSLKANHPNLVTVEFIGAKLDAWAARDDDGDAWVAEARLRVKEGLYHPHYTHKFESLEGSA